MSRLGRDVVFSAAVPQHDLACENHYIVAIQVASGLKSRSQDQSRDDAPSLKAKLAIRT